MSILRLMDHAVCVCVCVFGGLVGPLQVSPDVLGMCALGAAHGKARTTNTKLAPRTQSKDRRRGVSSAGAAAAPGGEDEDDELSMRALFGWDEGAASPKRSGDDSDGGYEEADKSEPEDDDAAGDPPADPAGAPCQQVLTCDICKRSSKDRRTLSENLSFVRLSVIG
jgi:hypothetical protein